jgi:hypothetical protein
MGLAAFESIGFPALKRRAILNRRFAALASRVSRRPASMGQEKEKGRCERLPFESAVD